jgi:hypothetical protein
MELTRAAIGQRRMRPLGVVPFDPFSNRSSGFGEVAEVVLPDTFLF